MPIFKHREARKRGKSEHAWLHARFTFSFTGYYDPEHCGFHSLIVMNNDVIEPGGGLDRHPHENAEIFTYTISGAFLHKDSMGNGSVVQTGDLQYMSAGDGVFHSELNPSDSEKVELLSNLDDARPERNSTNLRGKKLGKGRVKNEVKILFPNDGHEDSTLIRKNATLGFGQLEEGHSVLLEPDEDKPNAWVQVINGSLVLGDFKLGRTDGLGIEKIKQPISINAEQNCDFFIFRLSE